MFKANLLRNQLLYGISCFSNIMMPCYSCLCILSRILGFSSVCRLPHTETRSRNKTHIQHIKGFRVGQSIDIPDITVSNA